jgi:hypothetical protein
MFQWTIQLWNAAGSTSTFIQSALANFVGSFLAAMLIWFLITRTYELSKSKKEKRELLATSYALIKREIDAASTYCDEHTQARPDQVSASGPITQVWDTLHSMEAFKYFPPTVSEKLVKYYSLLFRLKKNIDFEQMLLLGEVMPLSGDNPYRTLRERTNALDRQVANEVIRLTPVLQATLDNEIEKLKSREKRIFDKAYEKNPLPANQD